VAALTGKEGDEVVTWRHEPLRRRPRRAAVVLAVAVACSWAAHAYVGAPAYSLPIVLAFLASLRHVVLPAGYALGPDGVRVDTPFGASTRGWDRVGGFREGPGGVLLTEGATPRALDRFRGLFLHVEDPAERGRVVSFLRKRFTA
jgi:hypothetical protein